MTPHPLFVFQKAYATGWLVAAPIGPVNMEIIRRGLRHRLAAAFALGLGACCVDAAYLTLFSLGLGTVLRFPPVQTAAYVLGGGLLSWLGISAILEARRFATGEEKDEKDIRDAKDAAEKARPSSAETNAPTPYPQPCTFDPKPSPLLSSYLVGVGMTATNPMTIAFWSALSLEFARLPVALRLTAASGVLLGALSWILLLMVILATVRRWVGARLFVVVNLAGGSVVLYFGLRFLWLGLHIERWLAG